MVRFIDDNTVFVNSAAHEDKTFLKRFRTALASAGLNTIELPYEPPRTATAISARGIYLNYLQMRQAIIVPTFRSRYDERAVKIFENIFKGQTIATVDCNKIADEGGVLNCITWNIAE